MTLSITLYPTEVPGIYQDQKGRAVTQIPAVPSLVWWCLGCTQIISTSPVFHWVVAGDFYCKNCIVVADEEDCHD